MNGVQQRATKASTQVKKNFKEQLKIFLNEIIQIKTTFLRIFRRDLSESKASFMLKFSRGKKLCKTQSLMSRHRQKKPKR